MQPLDARSFPALAGSVSVPSYDRSRVRVGIVHLGVGAFHRSHQAMYVDRLLEQGRAHDWGICGVGVLPSDRRMAEVMAAQGRRQMSLNAPAGEIHSRPTYFSSTPAS